jgi:hypothetical protein
MKTAQPREEYYRPARARELRERATKLEDWPLNTLGILSATLAAPALAIALNWILLLSNWCEGRVGSRLLWKASLPVCGLISLAIGSLYWTLWLQSWIQAKRKEAAALEAEHQARHGALPPSEGD